MTNEMQGILFDLDGTLLDTHDLILESMRYATRRVLGLALPDAQLMAKVGQPLATQMADFTSSEQQQEELLRVYRANNETLHDQRVRAFSGVVDVVSALWDAGMPMAVVTSKRHALAQRGLELCGLADMMAFVIGSDDCPTHKPDPGPVVQGCARLGVRPGECLYVGDSPFDMQAANGAGCVTAAALWGMFPADVLAAEHPRFELATIADLPPLLRILG